MSTPRPSCTRRDLFARSALGLAAAGLGGWTVPVRAVSGDLHPLAPKQPHFAPRAKRAILFFMTGGVSHVDSFDPKPTLQAQDGKTFGKGKQKLMASPWAARPRGASRIQTTDLFPHIGSMMDEICLIRSMHGDHGDHFEATIHMHTGSDGSALPSLGAWVSYGLGTSNLNLPSHLVFARDKTFGGSQVWDANFLPTFHQGVHVTPGPDPIPNLRHPEATAPIQNLELGLLEKMNRRHLETRRDRWALVARQLAFQTARSMQEQVPALFDLSRESDHTLQQYGVKRDDPTSFAWQCLMARRFAEQGVRFIELIDTGATSTNWDQHSNLKTHGKLAKAIDQPIAALLGDLKQRGMLEETLVIWCTEFGRTPFATGTGRGHHARAFTCWLAGGGVRGGHVHGATDEHGMHIAENPVHVHDFHATILHILGLDHTQLTYRHGARDFRLTDVHGNVVHSILT